MKQMDFLIRYWSESEGQVITQCIDFKFFGHAKANDLCNLIMEVFKNNGSDLKLMNHTSTDGSNIKRSLRQKLDESMFSLGFSELMPFVPCITHMGFHYGGESSCGFVWLVQDSAMKTSRYCRYC